MLIDGHNLIGQMSTLSLQDPNDETELVLLLRRYAARTRKRLTVIFDHGLPGGPSKLSGGGVRVVFASTGTNADALIRRRLRRHRRPAELTVVTSDRELIDDAEARGAQVVHAADFARRLEHPPTPAADTGEAPTLNEEEIEEWLRLFGEA